MGGCTIICDFRQSTALVCHAKLSLLRVSSTALFLQVTIMFNQTQYKTSSLLGPKMEDWQGPGSLHTSVSFNDVIPVFVFRPVRLQQRAIQRSRFRQRCAHRSRQQIGANLDHWTIWTWTQCDVSAMLSGMRHISCKRSSLSDFETVTSSSASVSVLSDIHPE